MEKFEIEINLEHIATVRKEWNEAAREFGERVDKAMKRLIHEAAAKRMSTTEVGKLSGFTTAQIKARMKAMGLNPSTGKTLLSRQAADVLASNAEIMGIEPHEIDLMSPLAYLPAGKLLKDQTASVHELDEEKLFPETVSKELGEQIAEINYCGHCDGLCADCQSAGSRAVVAFKRAWEAADDEGKIGHRVEAGLAAALKAAQADEAGA